MITALLLVSRILESIPPNVYTELDSDLKIKGGGGGGRLSSRPLDKGGGGGLPPKIFRPFRPQFGPRKKGGPGPPLLHTYSPDCSPNISLRN